MGQTLTVDTSAIADEDGLDNVSYSYQWIANDGTTDTDIEDATDSAYTPPVSDVGKTIKVRVTFTDDADNQESLTSADTDTVAATKPGVPGHLNVFPHDAGALDVYWESPASDGGSDITGYKVQWKENADSWDTPADVSEETASGTIHTVTGLTDGVEYSVRVLATNGVGDSPPSVEKTGTPRETKAPEMVRPRVDGATLKVLYDEALDEGSAPPTDSFDVRVACTCDDTTWLDEEAKRAVESVSVDGDTVVLTLVSAATSEDVVVVSYTPPSDAATSRTRDLAGNAAAGFNSTEVFNDTDETAESEENGEPGETPLTVSLEATTESHNGTDAFTFEIRFSEEFPLSYTTLKFHAFDVTGGEVLNAQRMDKPSNIRWLITVGPDSNGDVTVVLPVTEDCAAQGAICTEDGRPLSNRLDMTVTGPLSADQNTEATGAPTISGTAQVGETLTADVSSINDADGLTNVSYSYQWIRNDGGTDADIAGETASTHTLVSADEGKTIKVRVSFTDDAGNEETLTSAATAAVASRPNTPATGLPTISGTVQVDETLTADTSGISDADGLTNVSYSYQWIRNDGTNDGDIGGQTGSTYTLVSADEGKAIKVRVSFTDDAGNEETLTSSATAAVAVRPNTPATGLPTISGTAQVDETLTANISGMADEDGLTNVSYSYQWIRNDGTNDADIGGQTGSTYTLTDEDVGKSIKVKVSFTDDAGNEETLTSAATAAAAARPNTPATGLPTISGTAQAGKTLTANISGMADEDGLDNAEFSYQWLANDADIQNATDSTYTLTDDDVGKTIKVRVSFTDDRSNDETLTSAATDTVFAKPDSPDTDAPPRDPGATVDVTVGNTVTGEIEEAIEVDWFKVSLLASETYQIDMRGAWGGEWARIDGEIVWVAPGTLHDPKLLGVFSAANVLVPGTDEEVSGDDRGDYEEGKNSRITSFSPPADGYYYIAAAAEAAWTGTYELTVTVVADE